MKFGIAQKIFAVAVLVLSAMLAVSVHSIVLTERISEDLESVSQRQIPALEAISRISIRILEQGILLQRHLVLSEEGRKPAAERAHRRFRSLNLEIAQEMEAAKVALAEAADVGRHGRRAIDTLGGRIAAIETAHEAFVEQGEELLRAVERGARDLVEQRAISLNRQQDTIDAAIKQLRRDAAGLADAAIREADHDERLLLYSNLVLTAVAALLGLGLASVVTRLLVRGVRNLVSGTEAVEQGDLDTAVPVTSRDEVGQLTASFNHMVGELRLKERIKDTFGTYMDRRVVDKLLENPTISEPGGERREMTVMFIDLKGFTSISEQLPADDLVRLINRFFAHMTEAIAAEDGVVDKFMGDAVMAYWGPPFTPEDVHAALACRAGLQALERLEVFRGEVASELGTSADGVEIDLRIGISTGDMVNGTIGSTASKSFTVMGDPVNLGARLEGANKAYGTRLLISERTHALAGEGFTTREIDLIRVKGKAKPTRIYELRSGGRDGADAAFHEGLAAYRAQDWSAAERHFQTAKTAGDPVASVYVERVAALRQATTPTDWDGVWVFDTK